MKTSKKTPTSEITKMLHDTETTLRAFSNHLHDCTDLADTCVTILHSIDEVLSAIGQRGAAAFLSRAMSAGGVNGAIDCAVQQIVLNALLWSEGGIAYQLICSEESCAYAEFVRTFRPDITTAKPFDLNVEVKSRAPERLTNALRDLQTDASPSGYRLHFEADDSEVKS